MPQYFFREIIRNERIELNGLTYHLCILIECTLIFNRDGEPADLGWSFLKDCKLEGDGWPQGTAGEQRPEWEGNFDSRINGIWSVPKSLRQQARPQNEKRPQPFGRGQ